MNTEIHTSHLCRWKYRTATETRQSAKCYSTEMITDLIWGDTDLIPVFKWDFSNGMMLFWTLYLQKSLNLSAQKHYSCCCLLRKEAPAVLFPLLLLSPHYHHDLHSQDHFLMSSLRSEMLQTCITEPRIRKTLTSSSSSFSCFLPAPGRKQKLSTHSGHFLDISTEHPKGFACQNASAEL